MTKDELLDKIVHSPWVVFGLPALTLAAVVASFTIVRPADVLRETRDMHGDIHEMVVIVEELEQHVKHVRAKVDALEMKLRAE